MRKILFAVDALNVHTNSLDLATFISNLTKSKLTGIFLENVLEEEVVAEGYPSSEEELSANQREAITDQNIQLFKEACENRGVCPSISRDRGIPASELIEETRFADLLIIEPSLSFKRKIQGSPTTFVKTILSQASCPVIVSPESFEGIDEIVFAYDGSDSSILAIKQFTYLFPEFNNRKINLLEVNKDNEFIIKNKHKIADWLKVYYTQIGFEVLNGDAEAELFKYFLEKRNVLLVMGAYGRNMLSSFFRESSAELIMKTTNLPVFIAHC